MYTVVYAMHVYLSDSELNTELKIYNPLDTKQVISEMFYATNLLA